MDSYGKVTVIERDEPIANRFRIDRRHALQWTAMAKSP